MTRLRTILAENLKAYRKEMNISQIKLADLVDTAPNYIAMIEAEKRFPTDTMLEKLAIALEKDPYELFSITPIKKEWQKSVLVELSNVITQKLNET
ncbi:MAG: helix-turn-helix domain-containing protein [Treponema sp.]|nr:helix-turn-helix domain-containing protein [Treponema sp.]MCL2252684.1 helix-turn-helix domain-containing protein [Treponema sp.]